MVISKEQGHAQIGNTDCATKNAVKNTPNTTPVSSIDKAKKACDDALKEVMATLQFAR